ncbi:MAG: hypothetical protein IKG22_09675 [Atopobiaceae bacterium]|nr:hypothetical protein [Atopobiaceae bacterium]
MGKFPSLDNFSTEQLKKMDGMKNLDEVMAFAADEGIELTDEQLEAVSGGQDYWDAAAQATADPRV